MSASPAHSLFASDYSLSTPASPVSPRRSTLKSSISSSFHLRHRASDATTHSLRDQTDMIPTGSLPTPPQSPMVAAGPLPKGDMASPDTSKVKSSKTRKQSVAFSEDSQDRRGSDMSKAGRGVSRRTSESFEGCMEGEWSSRSFSRCFQVVSDETNDSRTGP